MHAVVAKNYPTLKLLYPLFADTIYKHARNANIGEYSIRGDGELLIERILFDYLGRRLENKMMMQ